MNPQQPYPAEPGPPWQPVSGPAEPGTGYEMYSAPPTPATGPPALPAGPSDNYPVPVGSPEQVLVQIGEIQVTASTVITPGSQFPVRGSTWYVTDRTTMERKTPSWAVTLAIVLTIVFFFCLALLSLLFLLFLLAKEVRYSGFVEVSVNNGPYQYVAQIPATDPSTMQAVQHQVNYVRSLAAQ